MQEHRKVGEDPLRRRLREPFRYPLREATEEDREVVDEMLKGSFRPATLFDPLPIGVPPPWDDNPTGNRSWDFHRHSWEWLEPAVTASDDPAGFRLACSVVESWAGAESRGPHRSRFWWNDHAAAIRARMLGFMWERFAEGALLSAELAATLLGLVDRHGRFLSDPEHYAAGSNHGLEMDASLIVLGYMFRELPAANRWVRVGEDRMEDYVRLNFSPIGFHLEQSPAYHSFVMIRLASILRFYVANDIRAPEALSTVVDRAAAVWHHLIRDDGSIPPIGDSPEFPKPRNWKRRFKALLGREAPPPAPSSTPNPRPDDSVLLIDPVAGYAILKGAGPVPLHLTAKCASFESPHRHHDATSFVLRAGGLDWITDSGYHSYEATPEREYVVSARAHNVVLVDDETFGVHPVSVLDYGRTSRTDSVTVEHDLGMARHRRTFVVDHSHSRMDLIDDVWSTDGMSHSYVQLFHLHPEVRVESVEGDVIGLSDATGRRAWISHDPDVHVEVRCGTDDSGIMHAWYSRDYGQWEQTHVIRISTPEASLTYRFEMSVTFSGEESSREDAEDRVDAI